MVSVYFILLINNVIDYKSLFLIIYNIIDMACSSIFSLAKDKQT